MVQQTGLFKWQNVIRKDLPTKSMSIGSSGQSINFDMTDLSESEACEEVKRVQRLIRKGAGKECILFRFLYDKGKLALAEQKAGAKGC